MIAAIQRPPKTKQANASSTPVIEVAIVTHFFSGHGGGIELVAERLIRELSLDTTFHFSWVASDCDPSPQIDGHEILPMRTCNIFEKLMGFPWPLWGIKSLRTLYKTIRKADVVWLHDTLYFGNILAFLVARKNHKPVIVTQHIAPIPYRTPLLRWAMSLADKLIGCRILKLADAVVFVSDRVAEDYYARVSFTKPIKVVPNGVDIRVFHPPIAENRRFLRQQFALKSEQPVMLFVGRFVEKKGMDVIRRLAALFPEWRFWLAGSGPINPSKWLLPNIHVISNRRGASLAELYQAADLLLIPSYGEGFPLVIQEALACGLPVMCSPHTAQGCVPAVPHLQLAEVFPDNTERTAAVWYDRLKALPLPLPLDKPQDSLSEFALASWDWRPIANVYAGIIKDLVKK